MLPPLARRFVAGESAAAALEHARRTNERNVGVICNRLGEHYHERAPAAADTAAYERLVADIGASDLRACISVKPSQLGLLVDETLFRENLARVVESAAEHGVFVWMDMEDHTTTDAAIDAFQTQAEEQGGGVGLCLQSNLRRTADDLERLADVPGKIRLVKGAYDPPADVAYQRKAEVNAAYRRDLEFLFRERTGGVAVGSHDPEMLTLAADLHSEYETPYEVQMLMGVRTDAQYELAGVCDVWQYAPFGSEWPAYFWRRVLERKENALFALRALAGG
ncbi:proline dehydrogenase family protein [Haloarcula nitratireducens]|uniref:proline dehydrogenase n=1 Tax=Haloarcula nitratireducens TaxID=2487749 RepID=A0AAW4PF37_9EURY|nr:proline dehydrogenase family protein [Halomicroarcula nitratireducens]MBX0296263.1 proline dehydrogenase family protein [Halomicroarcula nitratireducens]